MLLPAQSVLNPPGSMHVNLMPHSGLTSLDTASVKPSTAHLEAQYVENRGYKTRNQLWLKKKKKKKVKNSPHPSGRRCW